MKEGARVAIATARYQIGQPQEEGPAALRALSPGRGPGKIGRVRQLCLLLLMLAFAGCARRSTATAPPWIPAAAPDLGDVVATVAGVPIFAAQVAAQAAQSGKSPRAALADLIAFHLLAEQARGALPWPPPEGEDLRKRILVQRMLERELEPATRIEDLGDAEVRPFYDRARSSFVHPRLVEVATLEVHPPRNASAAVWAEARQTLVALKAVVDARRNLTLEDFMELGREESWRNRGVKAYRFLQGPEGPHPAKFAAVVAKLQTAGETTGIIEDAIGVAVARYLSDKPARNQSFEEVRAELRAGYYPRWRQLKFLEFTERVAAGHEVEIHSATAGPGS
jgi:parvulin-like peptidyl-prolyl cis-trans isomerase-like protein